MRAPLTLTILLVFCAALSGCSAPPAARVTQMAIANVAAPSVSANPTLVGILSVGSVTGGAETSVVGQSQVSGSAFKEALALSLLTNSLLAKPPDLATFEVSAHLHELDQPFAGFDMTVTSRVDYKVKNLKTGEIIFERTVVEKFTASWGDNSYGVERLRLANEGSIRKNTEVFLSEFILAWKALYAS